MYYYLRGSLFPYTFTDLIFFYRKRKTTKYYDTQKCSCIYKLNKKRPWQICIMKSTYNILVYMSEAAFIIYRHLKNITFECPIKLSRCTLMIEWIILVQIRIYYTKTTFLWQITVNSAKSIRLDRKYFTGFAIMLRNHVKNIFCL